MKQSEIIVGHEYSNGKSAASEQIRRVMYIYNDTYRHKKYVDYKITYLNGEVGLLENLYFHCLLKSFARWAKEDVT